MSNKVSKEKLLGMTDHELGSSDWLRVDQSRIDLFADATGDHQFIHVDPEKAAHTPFGSTIAHGFLSLSMLPLLSQGLAPEPEGMLMGINYGLNKVRFLQPVTEGSEVRLHARIKRVVEKEPGRLLVTGENQVEIKGQEKPALIAETLTLYVLA